MSRPQERGTMGLDPLHIGPARSWGNKAKWHKSPWASRMPGGPPNCNPALFLNSHFGQLDRFSRSLFVLFRIRTRQWGEAYSDKWYPGLEASYLSKYVTNALELPSINAQGHPLSVGSVTNMIAIGRNFPHRNVTPFIVESLVSQERWKIYLWIQMMKNAFNLGPTVPEG